MNDLDKPKDLKFVTDEEIAAMIEVIRPSPARKYDINWTLLDSMLALNADKYFCAESQIEELGLNKNGTSITAMMERIERRIFDRYGLNFRQYRDKRLNKLRIKVMQKQVETALEGNPTMLIWLGKNLLGQTDKHEVSVEERKGFEFIEI
jgi:hypothetical protein